LHHHELAPRVAAVLLAQKQLITACLALLLLALLVLLPVLLCLQVSSADVWCQLRELCYRGHDAVGSMRSAAVQREGLQ
jgi:hypothetical protein